MGHISHSQEHATWAVQMANFSQSQDFDANALARLIRSAPIRLDTELEVIVKAVAHLANDYDAMPHNCKQWDLCEMLDQAALLSEGTSL